MGPEDEGGGPPPGAASHHQTTSPHPHDQAADAGQSSRDGGQGASPQDDVRLFLDVLYGGGSGFCHVVYGEGWYRTRGQAQDRFWSETRERHAYAYPAEPTPPSPRSWSCPRRCRRLCEHQPVAHRQITREDPDGRAVVPARRRRQQRPEPRRGRRPGLVCDRLGNPRPPPPLRPAE